MRTETARRKVTDKTKWFSELVYRTRYKKHFSFTTTWMNVKDFYTFFKSKVVRYHGKKSMSKKAVQKIAKKGDVVQFKGKSGWHHSVMISTGKKGDWKYTAHSDNHFKKRIRSTNESAYRILRIL